MARLIDAEFEEKHYTSMLLTPTPDVTKLDQKNARIVIDALKMAPTVDAVPVVRGKWIIHKPFDSGRHNCNECIECSVCGTWFGHDCYEISNFCPNCGARMDGGVNDAAD